MTQNKTTKRNVKLTLAYDGSNYHGWQRQIAGIITVQEVTELAIARVVNHPVKLLGSGRTDTGVHAKAQVANFFTDTPIPESRLPHAINTRLPHDIRIITAKRVPDDFDAISSCKSKLYRYTIYNHTNFPATAHNYCNHYYHKLNIESMKHAAQTLLGQHDFASFASASKTPRLTSIRTLLRCDVIKKYNWLYFDLESNGFLYHMVRNIVGTLLDIGRGHWPPEKITEILKAKNRSAAGTMVPANGLSLQWVRYSHHY